MAFSVCIIAIDTFCTHCCTHWYILHTNSSDQRQNLPRTTSAKHEWWGEDFAVDHESLYEECHSILPLRVRLSIRPRSLRVRLSIRPRSLRGRISIRPRRLRGRMDNLTRRLRERMDNRTRRLQNLPQQ